MDTTLEKLEKATQEATTRVEQAIQIAHEEISRVESEWGERKQKVQGEYEQILRELQQSSRVDGEEFIKLRQKIEGLRPLRQQEQELHEELKRARNGRRTVLADWDNLKGEAFRALERAAKDVTRRLQGRVRVRVHFGKSRGALVDLLREGVGGRLSEAIETLTELADICRAGSDALVKKYGSRIRKRRRLLGRRRTSSCRSKSSICPLQRPLS